MDEEARSKIDKLNDKLYSRTRYRDPSNKRAPVKSTEQPNVEERWQTPELDEMLRHERVPTKINPFIKKVFVLAILFFVVAVTVAGFVFMGGANFISSRNVDIDVIGPTIVSAGETLDLGVSISNTNNADLEFANLSIQHPQGSRNPDNTNESLTYTKDDLGVIKAGSETVRNMSMVILGSPGETKEIKFSVEYKVKGSNATFYKDKIFEITIGKTPVALTIESPSTTVSGDSFTTTISVNLESSEILKNVVLKAEYPYGYSFLDATPKTANDNNIWVFGDLFPGDKKTITIKGRLVGEDKEERTFRFYVGVSDGGNINHNLKIVVTSVFNTIAITRQAVGLDVLFNGENVPTYVAPVARPISTSIKFKNNLLDKLLNPRLEVSLSGLALDKSSVAVGNSGFYDSNTSKIFWNLTNSLGKSELAPGEGGQVSIKFSSLPSTSASEGTRDIRLAFLLTGIPVGTIGQQPIAINETRLVKISSQVNFSSKILHSLGSFANRGPIPPKVGKETTYTTSLSLGNTQGNLTDAKVTAQLGQGVSWLGASSFASEDISYDSLSNTVTWNIGTLLSDTGFSSATRELSFQISLTPLLGQVGTAPTLITGIVFSGRDTVTGNTVTVSHQPLTTRLSDDPAFIQGDDIVVK